MNKEELREVLGSLEKGNSIDFECGSYQIVIENAGKVTSDTLEQYDIEVLNDEETIDHFAVFKGFEDTIINDLVALGIEL